MLITSWCSTLLQIFWASSPPSFLHYREQASEQFTRHNGPYFWATWPSLPGFWKKCKRKTSIQEPWGKPQIWPSETSGREVLGRELLEATLNLIPWGGDLSRMGVLVLGLCLWGECLVGISWGSWVPARLYLQNSSQRFPMSFVSFTLLCSLGFTKWFGLWPPLCRCGTSNFRDQEPRGVSITAFFENNPEAARGLASCSHKE